MFREKLISIRKIIKNSFTYENSSKSRIVYGPVLSRRLGYVIGINNIKSKFCSYNCVYCPEGQSKQCSVCIDHCISPYEIYMAVRTKLEELEKSGKSVKYLVINGRGEPTLDSGLSKTIQLLREFGLKIAVFTNSSLIWDNNVQQNLMCADYVSLKLDTVIEDTWYKINRPPRRLDFNAILNGIKEFSEKYQGHLSTATTFIKDMNDNQFEINALADFLKEVKCESSCFMTPRYPPSDKNAESPDEEKLQQLQSLLKERIINPLLLCCPENEVFDVTGDFEDEFLGLLSIHPIQVSAVRNYIRSDEDLEKLKNLIEENFIKEIIQDDKKYYAIEDKKRTESMRMQI